MEIIPIRAWWRRLCQGLAFVGDYKSREDKADGSWHSAPVKECNLRHTPSLACRLTILSCHICKTWTPCSSGNISKPSNRHVDLHWGSCYVTTSFGPWSQDQLMLSIMMVQPLGADVKRREILTSSLPDICWNAKGKIWSWWCMQEFNYKGKCLNK
jgi:hypothetical protein